MLAAKYSWDARHDREGGNEDGVEWFKTGRCTADLTGALNPSALTGITLIITHANAAKIRSDAAGVSTYLQIGASTCSIGRDDDGSLRATRQRGRRRDDR